MLLRASGRHDGADYDLAAIVGDGDGDGGVPEGRLLSRFAEAILGTDEAALATARRELNATLGPEALVDTAAVAALFNAIDRIADATGIPLEDDKMADSADFRATLGIDDFPSMAHR